MLFVIFPWFTATAEMLEDGLCMTSYFWIEWRGGRAAGSRGPTDAG
jgi:hypothetical protein